MQTFNAVQMAHHLLKNKLAIAKCVIDATTGKGNDTLFLAVNTPPDARILAFDIQSKALQDAKKLLQQYGCFSKVQFILDNHVNIPSYVQKYIDVVMFNLGYLPGTDHRIMTEPLTTLTALEHSINMLNVGGMISLIVYPGHAMGEIESKAVKNFLTQLSPRLFAVGCWSTINHQHNPPVLYLIEKVRSEVREDTAPR